MYLSIEFGVRGSVFAVRLLSGVPLFFGVRSSLRFVLLSVCYQSVFFCSVLVSRCLHRLPLQQHACLYDAWTAGLTGGGASYLGGSVRSGLGTFLCGELI